MRELVKGFLPEKLWRTARNVVAHYELLPRMSGTHDSEVPDTIVRTAREYLTDYFEVGGLTPETLAGKSMLEIGPGNNLSVSLLFLAAGVGQAVCIDRFRSRREPDQANAAYHSLYDQMSDAERERSKDVWRNGLPQISDDLAGKLVYLSDCPVEQGVQRLGRERFDLIISRSVLEHVYNLHETIRSMSEMLKPGGQMVHKVDLRSHEEKAQSHPLEFLTHSPRWWRWMTSHTGEPNRLRKGAYRKLLQECEFKIKRFDITHSIPQQEVATIRDRLAVPFRNLPEDELTDTGVFFDVRKPS